MVPPAKSPLDDINSPFFLHPSDAANLILVSQPLTEDNYASWSRAMTMVLTVKNKIGFINGAVADPGIEDASLQIAWIRNQNMVMSWILNSVSKEIQASIMYSSTAQKVWLDLKTRFSQTNGPRIYQLRRDLANLVQGSQSVNAYFTKVKAIWDELENYRSICSCGKCECGGVSKMIEQHNHDLVLSFLMGLGDHLQHTRGQILLMDPPPSINKVFSFVTQEERQRSICGPNLESSGSVFALKNSSPSSSGPSRPPPHQSNASFLAKRRREATVLTATCMVTQLRSVTGSMAFHHTSNSPTSPIPTPLQSISSLEFLPLWTCQPRHLLFSHLLPTLPTFFKPCPLLIARNSCSCLELIWPQRRLG